MSSPRHLLPRFLLAALASLILQGCGARASEGKAAPPLKPRMVAVEKRELRRDVSSVGSLFAFDEVAVSSEIEGRVDKVLVDLGDHVAAGQALVEVSPVVRALAREQFDDYVKRVRVFAHPRIAGALRARADLGELIQEAVGQTE